MKKILMVILFSAIISTPLKMVIAQSEKPVRLLEQWFGVWKGKLDIKTSDGQTNTAEMTLSIYETGTPGEWNWVTSYGETLSQKYILKMVSSEKGIYKLDENNSIILDYFLSDNTFYCTFSAKDNLVISTYQLTDGEINFEVVSSPMNSANISNDEKDENDLIYSYPVYAVQKAVLKKE